LGSRPPPAQHRGRSSSRPSPTGLVFRHADGSVRGGSVNPPGCRNLRAGFRAPVRSAREREAREGLERIRAQTHGRNRLFRVMRQLQLTEPGRSSPRSRTVM
jgi:hypothetical protein